MLLQQTRVAQAVPFFERLVGRFPTVQRLAAARPADVLKAWQGAGYYARARRLHRAARRIVAERGGRLPSTVEELERLPGVGPYTARAVAAIAFGAPVLPLDANVLRVAARWTCDRRDTGRAAVRRDLATALQRWIPPGESGAFVEGVMELGETVCLPRAPRCDRCPVARTCRARQELVDPGALPRRPGRRPRPHVRGAVVAVQRGDRWLVQRRALTGLLGGLWEFPGGKIEPGETAVSAARRELREETGLRATGLRPVDIVRHGYSHFTVELHVYRGRIVERPAPAPNRRWATLAEIARLPLPRATEKIVRALGRTAAPVRVRPRRGSTRRPGPRGSPERTRGARTAVPA